MYAESAEQLHENTARRKENRRVNVQQKNIASRRIDKKNDDNSINSSSPTDNNNYNNHSPTYRSIEDKSTRKSRPLPRSRSVKTQQSTSNQIQKKQQTKNPRNRNRQYYSYKAREEISTRPSTRTTSFIEDFSDEEREYTTSKTELKTTTTNLPITEFTTQEIQGIPLTRNDLSNDSDETQIFEETANFYKNSRNRIEQNYKPSLQNSHPNHRDTYSDLKEPKYYSTKIISTLNSVTPQYLTTQPLNNGRPFLGSQVGTTYIHPTGTVPPPTSPGLFNLGFNESSVQFTTPGPSKYSFNISTNNDFNVITPPPIGSFNVGTTKSTTESVLTTIDNLIDIDFTRSTLPSTFFTDIDPTTSTSPPKTTNHAIVYGKFIKAVPTVATTPKKVSPTRKFITLTKSLFGGGSTNNNRVSSEILSTSDSIHGTVPRVRFSGSVSKSLGKGRVKNKTQQVRFSVKNQQTIDLSTTPSPQSKVNNIVSTTTATTTTTTTTEKILINKPRPFQLPPRETFITTEFTTTKTVKPTYPTYKISSASPFALSVASIPTEPTTLPNPTLPATFENVDSMINALAEMATQNDFSSSSRPGLIIPPSAGPQTLHTLAQYFANALDGISTDKDQDEKEETEKPPLSDHELEKKRLTALLTKMTMDRYNELFIEDQTEATSTISDLELQDTKAPPAPKVRQLAKVFTQALSSYLDDPVTFKKILEEVRPTEPPSLETEEFSEADDELLNFSDADIKSSYPPFVPTPAPRPRPTWGYILAYNQTQNFDIKNSISAETENLQGADSQSLVSQLNKLQHNNRETSTRSSLQIPDNHWTTSSNANALWSKAFSFDPASINDNFGTTEALPPSTFPTESTDLVNFPQLKENVQEIKYEVRALPQLALNSTQLHGILIEFMNTTKTEEDNRLHRILRKLNTTEDEFISKMREIESNPLTRRLILLLISECGDSATKNIETEAVPLHSLVNLRQQETLEAASSISGFRPSTNVRVTEEKSTLQKIVHPNLDNSNEDARALQLLNSLYTIASKFGK